MLGALFIAMISQPKTPPISDYDTDCNKKHPQLGVLLDSRVHMGIIYAIEVKMDQCSAH